MKIGDCLAGVDGRSGWHEVVETVGCTRGKELARVVRANYLQITFGGLAELGQSASDKFRLFCKMAGD